LADDGGNIVKHQIDVLAHHIVEGWRAATVGDVHHVAPCHALEESGRQVHRRADTGGGVVELARIGLGMGDEVSHAVGRQMLAHAKQVRDAGDMSEQDKVLLGIKRHARV
jgi:hypothetical protein